MVRPSKANQNQGRSAAATHSPIAAARQSRRPMPTQASPLSAGMNVHHSAGVPSSSTSEAQLGAPHVPSPDQWNATGRPSRSHCHGQDW